MKTDWIMVLFAFQFGFCGNATLWRIAHEKTDDIMYPAMCAVLALFVLSIRGIMDIDTL